MFCVGMTYSQKKIPFPQFDQTRILSLESQVFVTTPDIPDQILDC